MEQISMPILALVDQKQLNADSIISPVVELPESRKLSITRSRSPLDNPSRHNPTAAYAPGTDPNNLYAQDAKSQTGSTSMQAYAAPQMAPPSSQNSGYANYVTNNATHHLNQTYPGLQVPRRPVNGYANGLQIPSQPYQNGNMQNEVQQYGMIPVSTTQQQQSLYTDSPVDTMTTPFPSYYSQEPQGLTTEMPNVGYDTSNAMSYQQGSTYPAMSYLTAQRNYQYQHQQ
jgi:hypothetical protein